MSEWTAHDEAVDVALRRVFAADSLERWARELNNLTALDPRMADEYKKSVHYSINAIKVALLCLVGSICGALSRVLRKFEK